MAADQPDTAAREIRDFLKTWLVLMVLGSLPGLAFVGILYGARYVLTHCPTRLCRAPLLIVRATTR